jgi:OmpA family
MNKQSQWLFEAPPTLEAVRTNSPKSYRLRQRRSMVGQTLVSDCPPTSLNLKPWKVYGWSQYRTSVKELPPDQQNIIKQVGDIIVRSFKPSCQKILKIQIYGHADHDTPRNLPNEQKKSQERAQATRSFLQSYVGGMITSQIDWSDTRGLGAINLQAPPTTEDNRKKNRRVEIVLTVSSSPPSPPDQVQGQGDGRNIQEACGNAVKECEKSAKCSSGTFKKAKCDCWKSGYVGNGVYHEGYTCIVKCSCEKPISFRK